MWNVCIYYVQEDKHEVVRPLVEALTRVGLTVGYEGFVLTPGKNLQQFLDRGLNNSRCGIVVLSPHFFEYHWTQDELHELSSHENRAGKVLFHVWHNVTRGEVQGFSPVLAEEMAIFTSEGFNVVTQLVLSVFDEQNQESDQPSGEFPYETIIVDARGEIIHHEHHIGQQHLEDLGNGMLLEMVSVPGGEFLMGVPDTGEKQRESERPQHPVRVAPFYMGKFPITQEQWEAMMGANPSNFIGPKRPVDTISWHAAVEFCEKLLEQTGRAYRLPNEAEWEYACRAKTTTPFYFGDTITSDLANYNGAIPYAREPKGIFRGETTEVGSFPPNTFGLYDMHGNVREWCADPWHKNYYRAPLKAIVWQEWGNSSLRILRGGAWDFNCFSCRSAGRSWRFPVFGAANIGCRVVYSADET